MRNKIDFIVSDYIIIAKQLLVHKLVDVHVQLAYTAQRVHA